MKARSRELLDRAIAAMVAAIEVYNRPSFTYRVESFAILALNAWELLLKAKWLALHNNQIRSLYVLESKKNNRKRRYKRTRSENPMTHSLDYLAKKFTEKKLLDGNAQRNLDVLCDLRDSCVHFYLRRNAKLNEHVQEIGMACVKNFVVAVQGWFGEDLSRFDFYLMPLSFVTPMPSVEGLRLNREEKRFLEFLNTLTAQEGESAFRYSVAANIEVKFVRSKAATAIPVRVTTDPTVPEIRLTEEQIRERYPWDYQELTDRCRERYVDFKVNKEYHDLRRTLANNPRFAYERLLDPEKPNSPRKVFYSTAILEQFDTYYHRKR